MGIKGLYGFIRDNFKEWRHERVEGNLVIDGCQLCHKLYYSSLWEGEKTGWVYGSQYPEFRATVVRFFQALKDAKVTPTVVFDGILHLDEKKVVLERHKKNARTADRQRTSSTPVSNKLLAPLVYQAFNAILQELGVTQLVADGDGDVAIAHTANKLNCPVLSEDSDFYMFNIPRGYIHLGTFMREVDKPPRQIRTLVFHISDFIKQFGLPTDNSLHLVIPAIRGCDYLRRLPEVDECIPLCTADDNRMKHLITYLKQFKSFEEFLASIPQVNRTHEKLRENYDKAVKLYGNTAVGNSNTLVVRHSLPQWLADRYHCGNIIYYLLQARLLRYQLPASSATSKLLRQYAYGILGVPSVKEYPTCDGTVEEVRVEAMDSIQGDPSQLLPKLAEVEILSPESRKQLMCQMLACNNGVIETLEEKWKLVVASVIFWAKVEPRTEGLLKALIGCFVLCSSQSVERLREIHGQIRRHKRENWQAHHSTFATWQCTYIAAVSLNQLLMEPLQSTSAACLFDSKLATSLVAEPNIDRKMEELGISCDLYQSLLDTVLSQYEVPAEIWKTVKRDPKPLTTSRKIKHDTKLPLDRQKFHRRTDNPKETVTPQKRMMLVPFTHHHRCERTAEPNSRETHPYKIVSQPDFDRQKSQPTEKPNDMAVPQRKKVTLVPYTNSLGAEATNSLGAEATTGEKLSHKETQLSDRQSHGRRLGDRQWGSMTQRRTPVPQSHRAGLPPEHSHRAGRKPEAARGKPQSKSGREKQSSASQTKGSPKNIFELLQDDCDD